MRFLALSLILTSCATSNAPVIESQFQTIAANKMSRYVVEESDMKEMMEECLKKPVGDSCDKYIFKLFTARADAKYPHIDSDEFYKRTEPELLDSNADLLAKLIAVHAKRQNGFSDKYIERFYLVFAYEEIGRELELDALAALKQRALEDDLVRVRSENAATASSLQGLSNQMQINQQQGQIRQLQCQQYQQQNAGNRVYVPCR